MTFASLGLAEPILGGVRAAGYESPTDIQAHAIPLLLDNRDLIGLGQTGSGKTAAFGLPILNRLLQGERGLRALILVPTRELCVQVAENLRVYASRTDLGVCTAFGGIPLSIQESAFKRGLDVLVACPGRLLDHLERGNLNLQNVEVVVLDEADRMLDMGFLPQIRRILVRCPPRRQTLLFSATMPPEMEQLCSDFLPDAEIVQVGRRSQAAPTIAHEFLQVSESEKARALEGVLRRESGRVLIFVKTKIKAEQLGRKLRTSRLPADSIHGDKSAEARHTVLRSFDGGRTRFLVATDVAARGIDVDDIALVVNYDMPRAMEDYIHRVGRTGRAGSSGRALSFCTPADRGLLATIRKHLETTAAPKAGASAGAAAGAGARCAPERRTQDRAGPAPRRSDPTVKAATSSARPSRSPQDETEGARRPVTQQQERSTGREERRSATARAARPETQGDAPRASRRGDTPPAAPREDRRQFQGSRRAHRDEDERPPQAADRGREDSRIGDDHATGRRDDRNGTHRGDAPRGDGTSRNGARTEPRRAHGSDATGGADASRGDAGRTDVPRESGRRRRAGRRGQGVVGSGRTSSGRS